MVSTHRAALLLSLALGSFAALACGGGHAAPVAPHPASSSAMAPAASADASARATALPKDDAWVETECLEGKARACSYAGRLLARGGREPAKAAHFFRRACELDVAECAANGKQLAMPESDLPEPGLVLDLLGAACARGLDGEECRGLGRLCASRPYSPAVWETGCAALSAKCDQAPRACVASASYAWNRAGERAKLDAYAVGAAEKACDAKVAAGCRQVTAIAKARLLGDGGHAKDTTWGLATLDKQCARGEAWACRDLGDAHDDGKAVSRDRIKARAWWEKACVAPGLACDAALEGATDRLADWDEKTFTMLWGRLSASCVAAEFGCPGLGGLVDRFALSAPPVARAKTKERYQEAVELMLPHVWRDLAASARPSWEVAPVAAWMKTACTAGAPRACSVVACVEARNTANDGCVELNGRKPDVAACKSALAAADKACPERAP